MASQHTSNNRKFWLLLTCGSAAIVLIWGSSAVVVVALVDRDYRGDFGDLFGAVNALFTGLAFYGVVVSLLIQRDQLANQHRELVESRHAQEQAANALQAKLELDQELQRRGTTLMLVEAWQRDNMDEAFGVLNQYLDSLERAKYSYPTLSDLFHSSISQRDEVVAARSVISFIKTVVNLHSSAAIDSLLFLSLIETDGASWVRLLPLFDAPAGVPESRQLRRVREFLQQLQQVE